MFLLKRWDVTTKEFLNASKFRVAVVWMTFLFVVDDKHLFWGGGMSDFFF